MEPAHHPRLSCPAAEPIFSETHRTVWMTTYFGCRSVKLPVATLYGALDRLCADQLIEVLSEEIVDGRARRTYALTKSGHEAMFAEARRLAQLASVVLTPGKVGFAAVPGRLDVGVSL